MSLDLHKHKANRDVHREDEEAYALFLYISVRSVFKNKLETFPDNY